MPQPHVLILRSPGTNCDRETAFAFEMAGAKTESLHINRLLESPDLFERFQILCIPGGFSYGDDVAAGRIEATQMQHHLAEHLAQFKAAGKLILGICNGFQVMIKAGILLDDDPRPASGCPVPAATLTYNDSGKYEDRWVRLGVEGGKCVFLRGIQEMYVPVAHGEGKFIARDTSVLAQLEKAGQLALRYLPLSGAVAPAANGSRDGYATTYPDNPNGSMGGVAGVCDVTGRVMGLMPHPERHVDPTQHPRWTRGEAGVVGDGLQMFVNAVKYFG